MDKPQSNLNNQFDEISITELLQIVIKRKWLAVSCCIITMLGVAFYSFSIKPVYKSTVVIQIGKIGISPMLTLNGEDVFAPPIEDPVILGQMLKTTKKVFSVSVEKIEKITTNVLTLTSHSNNPYKAQASLKKITDDLVKRHDFLLNQKLNYNKERLNSFNRQLNSLQIQLDFYEKQLLRYPQNDSVKIWLNAEKMRVTDERFELERQSAEQELLLSENYVQPTRLLEEPSLNLKPIKPNLPLNLELGLILGVIFGVIAALIIEKVNIRKPVNKQLNY